MAEEIIKLRINPEYEKLIPPLPTSDYNELKKSIQDDGLYYPIVINEKGEVLDGHHRYKICNELKREFRTEIKRFDNPLAERKFVIKSNFNRRHLEMYQRAALADELHRIELQEKKNIITVDKKKSTVIKPKRDYKREDQNRKKRSKEKTARYTDRKTRKIAAKTSHLSEETLRKYQHVLKHADPEIKEQMTTGRVKIDKAYNMQKREEMKEKFLQTNKEKPIPKGCKLLSGDFMGYIDSQEVPNNSIDLIFTDPPYGEAAIIHYKNLADFADRKLKDGGSLVTYTGQYTLPQVIEALGSKLKYWWIICVKHTGVHDRNYPRQVFIEWKPLLWYIKGQKPNIVEVLSDYIISKQEKSLHDWQQSTLEADHVITRLTLKGQVVMDPFLGSGTTGLSAKKLERQFIGVEIDKDTLNIARANIGLGFQET